MLALLAALVAQIACPSAVDLEGALNTAQVLPYVSQVESVGSPVNHVASMGGFLVVRPKVSPGEIVWNSGASASFSTACGWRTTWQPRWTGGVLVGASGFSVHPEAEPPLSINRFGDATYSVTPELTGSRLTIERPGRPKDIYRLNFRATAISLLPDLHGNGVRLETIGLQPDGSVVYAEFHAN